MKNGVKVAAAVLAASLLAMTGCSSAGDSAGGPGPITSECPAGVTTLKVLTSEFGFPKPSQIEDYAKIQPCIKFDAERVPFAQLSEKISVAASSNNQPDIIGFDGPWTQNFASLGILAPLDPYLPSGWKDDAVSATVTEQSYKDQLYGMGVQQDSLALFYNKNLTDAAGIKVPSKLEDAWTWEEARDAMAKCQQGPAENPTVWGWAPNRWSPGFSYRDQLFLRSEGDPKAPKDSTAYKTYYAISDDGKSASGWLNTPEAIKGATFYQSLFSGPNAVASQTAIPNSLIDQRSCFDIEVVGMIDILNKANVDFEWGIAPLPFMKTPIAHTGSITMGVPAKSKNKEIAGKTIVEMSTGAMLKQYSEQTFAQPALKSTAAEVPALNEEPYVLFTQEIQQIGVPRPPSAHYVQYDQFVGEALKDIAYGADPKTALDKAASRIDPFLAK
ncbi:extracellular solute-binding protein [Specibacter sp. NPDC078709]|uniref:extracellular solute-binding protein n=1 Tax=Specibacter sp. NPDC078709 TaxID=3154364 RepID=UPI003447ED2D